jgi:hypothetical protein
MRGTLCFQRRNSLFFGGKRLAGLMALYEAARHLYESTPKLAPQTVIASEDLELLRNVRI